MNKKFIVRQLLYLYAIVEELEDIGTFNVQRNKSSVPVLT